MPGELVSNTIHLTVMSGIDPGYFFPTLGVWGGWVGGVFPPQ